MISITILAFVFHSYTIKCSSDGQYRYITFSIVLFQIKDPNRYYEETVKPNQDYFSCSFLLAFPVAGLYNVHIKGLVLDNAGTKWNTGPQMMMTFKSYDESTHRKSKQASSRTSFGQI